MKRFVPLVLIILSVAGCFSVRKTSPLKRADLEKGFSGAAPAPFRDLQVLWQEIPPRTTADVINEPPGDIKLNPRPVPAEDLKNLEKISAECLKEFGLFDAEKGTGTLKVRLASLGRWNYHNIYKGLLVDTPLIFILPASVLVTHRFYLAGEISGKPFKFDDTAVVKTHFHLLVFPLFPLFNPRSQEKEAIRHMLYKTAMDLKKFEQENQPLPAQ